ncbi:unnamed protein product [Bursaphelenchus xylophilus]|uniref:(pine wood nematode) hypothetical protein n=1 Tax=Bursaphelenchus xylophilus TaxID=6326 RepID=A0A1I7SUY0_BURXY|nr:unnamed protein product [Bursaphelenchus xylophilus]CAG9125764.1 unnamed protein product [Bursaphelenchus xylophilus]
MPFFRYYAFNLIMPCVLTMILVVLGFTLNPFSCEKIGLQISVSLAICIFMTIMAEMTPQTSEAVPLLGIFFQSCMVISVLATAFTVYVQSVHFRSYGGGHRMGFWMRYILLELMPWLLRIQRPKQKVNLDTLKASFRKRKEEALLSDEEKDDPEEFSKQIDHYAYMVKGTDSYLAGKLYTLNKIYNHIRTIRMKNDDAAEENEIRSEWQFGAVIVDRLCLIVFTLLIVITGTTIAVQAPYLVA